MNLTKLFCCIFIAANFYSCTDENVPFIKQRVNETFTIEVPDYMTKLDLEHPEAQFQFGNEMKEHYVMVIRNSNADFINSGVEKDLEYYTEFNIDLLEKAIPGADIEKSPVQEINGMQAIELELHGVFPENQLAIYYDLVFYSSPSAIYYVATWTLEEFEERYRANIKKITHSLKEI